MKSRYPTNIIVRKVNLTIDARKEIMIQYQCSRLSEKWRKGYHISDNTKPFIFKVGNIAIHRCHEAVSSQKY